MSLDLIISLSEAILPASIAALASIVVVCYTQYQSKKLTFFQTYFNKKLEVYSMLWEAESIFERTKSPEHYAQLTAALHALSLFSPEDIYQRSLEATAEVAKKGKMDPSTIVELTELMREDLARCKKLDF